MTRWVTPSDTAVADASARPTGRPPDQVDRREPNVERREQLQRREQVDAYKQILNPAPAPRRGRMVARGAIGLALLGLARVVWRAAPEPSSEAAEAAPAVRTDTHSRFKSESRHPGA